MKKVKLTIIALVSSALIFSSCSKEDSASTVTNPTGIPTPTFKYGLTIHVLPTTSNSNNNGRVEGLTGATVTVKQNGATIGTVTTDESGIATFSGLTEGSYSYFVKATNYASINGSGFISYDGNLNLGNFGNNNTTGGSTNNYGINGEIAYADRIEVGLKKLGASVSGVLRADLTTNGTTTLTTGSVRLTLDNAYLEPNVYTAPVDANGKYIFSALPINEDFTLSVVDIYGNQPAVGNTPAFIYNLVFPNASGTTGLDGSIEHRGVTTLSRQDF